MQSAEAADLTAQAKEWALELGADVVGVTDVATWRNPPAVTPDGVHVYPPTGYAPDELLPTGRSVIVLGLGQLAGVIESNVSAAATTYPFGNYGYVHLNRTMSRICFELARWLERRSYRALPLGAVVGSRFDRRALGDDSIFAPQYGVFSMKRAAVLAGIGRRARNGLVASPRFGPRIRLAAVITAAPLDSDPPLAGDPCPPECTICMDVCPTDAIMRDGRVNHYRCFSDCGRRGHTWEELRTAMAQGTPSDLPGVDYTANDYRAIDSVGNRMCKVACMALCPLGEDPSPDVLRRARGWARSYPKVPLAGFPPSPG